MRDRNHLMAELLYDGRAERFYDDERRRIEGEFYQEMASKKGLKRQKSKGGYGKRLQARFAQKRREN